MAMTFKAFSQANRTRCESPDGFAHALESWSLSDWITAVAGELGEAANVIKKLNRIRDSVANVRAANKGVTEAELRQQLEEEIADTFCYLDLLAQAAGCDLEQIVVAKFEKVSERIGYMAALDEAENPTPERKP